MINDLIKILTPFMTSKSYAEGGIITQDLVSSDQIFLVTNGAVTVEYTSIETDSDRRIALLITEGAFIGLEYLFTLHRKTQSRIIAVKDSTVLSLNRVALKALLEGPLAAQKAEILAEINTVMAEALARFHHKIEALTLHANYPKTNIMTMLTELAAKIGIPGKGGTTVPVKIATLAKLTGLSEDTTRRCSTILVEEGRIARIGKGNFLVFT